MDRKHQRMRPFLMEIRELVKGLTREALEEVTISFARECRPGDRDSFRNRLRPGDSSSVDAEDFSRAVVAKASEFARSVQKGHFDEALELSQRASTEGDFRSQSWAHQLNKYFDEAHRLFLAGKRMEARQMYERLLSVFFLDEEYGHVFGRRGISNIYQGDIRETCSRYFRALYDTLPMEHRAARLAEAMRSFGLLCPTLPLFQDVMDAAEDPIVDLGEFLPLWIRVLKERAVERHQWGWVSIWDELLAEAATIQEGAKGAEKIARESGPYSAMAYLKWIQALVEEKRRAEALEAGGKALEEVWLSGKNRAEIADYLARLAAEEGDENLSRLSRREAFCSYPTLGRLIHLYREAHDDEETGAEMARAAQKLEEITARTSDDVELEDRSQDLTLLHARAILLAGQMEQAIELAKKGNPLGWTFGSDPQGVVVPCMLVAAAGIPSPSRTPFIYKVWASYPAPDEAEDEFKALFLQSLRKSIISLQERHRLFSLFRPMIHARIDAIMEGQKRDSYRKAGHLVLAEREALIELDRPGEAEELVEQTSRRYRQASRFQRELHMAGVI